MDDFYHSGSMEEGAMNEYEQKLSVYDDVCRVIGRAVVMLKETNQPVTKNSINLMLQAHSDQSDDAYLSRIYAVAKDVME
ncbi:TPA: DUF2767 domain-containing protein [Salmonella enterica subsp. enterica serovar Potsdam]